MRELARRIFLLVSVVGAGAVAVMAKGISTSATFEEIGSCESWQWCDPVDEE